MSGSASVNATTSTTIAAITAILAFPSACSDAPGDVPAETSTYTMRDSAGVEIVENVGNAIPAERAWRLSEQPLISIGLAEGDEAYQLYQVTAALRLPDGGVVVLNGGSKDLRFYDRSGVHVRSVGGAGDGPGEFRNPFNMGWFARDTIGVIDLGLARVSLFDVSGEFLRSFAPPSALDLRTTAREFGGDGWLLMAGSAAMQADTVPELETEISSTYVEVREDGSVLPPFDRFGSEITMESVGGRNIPIAMNLARAGQITVGPGVVAFSDTRTRQFEILDRSGALNRLIRHSESVTLVTPELLERYFDTRVQTQPEGPARASLLEALRSRPSPDTLATSRTLRFDRPDGNLWVMDYFLPWHETRRWTVFSPEGVQLTQLEVPSSMTLWDIGSDFVLAKQADEFGIERIVVFGLIKRE